MDPGRHAFAATISEEWSVGERSCRCGWVKNGNKLPRSRESTGVLGIASARSVGYKESYALPTRTPGCGRRRAPGVPALSERPFDPGHRRHDGQEGQIAG